MICMYVTTWADMEALSFGVGQPPCEGLHGVGVATWAKINAIWVAAWMLKSIPASR